MFFPAPLEGGARSCLKIYRKVPVRRDVDTNEGAFDHFHVDLVPPGIPPFAMAEAGTQTFTGSLSISLKLGSKLATRECRLLPSRHDQQAVAASHVEHHREGAVHGPGGVFMDNVVNHEDWVYADVTGKVVANGNGISSLSAVLPDNDVGYAAFRLQGQFGGGDVAVTVILQWKGPASSPMKKNKSNGGLQHALDVLTPNKGFIEVLGKRYLTTANIYDRWRPGANSKVIEGE